MNEQLNILDRRLDDLINDPYYHLIHDRLESLKRLTSSQSKPEDELSALLHQLLRLHSFIKDQETAPHDALKRILAEASADPASSEERRSFSRTFLGESVTEIKRELDTIVIPVALLVMTTDEAMELASDEVYKEYPNFEGYSKQINALQELLLQEQITGLLDRYSASREGWEPFGTKETISKLIREGFDKVTDFNRPLAPEFVDIVELTVDGNAEAREELKLLRKAGCMVVMDLVSMQHPTIQKAYRRSFLDVYLHIPVIKVAPTHSALGENAKQDMIGFVEKFSAMEFAKRRMDLDPNCAEVFDPQEFKSSLVIRAPALVEERIRRVVAKNVQSSFHNSDEAV